MKAKKIIILTILAVFILCIAQIAFATVELDTRFKPEYSPSVTLKDGAGNNPAAYGVAVLQTIAGGLITLAAPVAIVIIAIAGLMAVVSHGNQNITEKAKKTLFAAIIGLIIIIFSWIGVRAAIELVLRTDDYQPPVQEQQELQPIEGDFGEGTTSNEERFIEDLIREDSSGTGAGTTGNAVNPSTSDTVDNSGSVGTTGAVQM